MIYTVKISFKVTNLEQAPGCCIMSKKKLKNKLCLNVYNRCIEILVNLNMSLKN